MAAAAERGMRWAAAHSGQARGAEAGREAAAVARAAVVGRGAAAEG